MHLQLVFLGHGAADGRHHRLHIRFAVAARHFMHKHQLLFAIVADWEGRAHTRFQRLMALPYRMFDVLRVMVTAVDDNQILQPSGNVQFPPMQKTEIAGA